MEACLNAYMLAYMLGMIVCLHSGMPCADDSYTWHACADASYICHASMQSCKRHDEHTVAARPLNVPVLKEDAGLDPTFHKWGFAIFRYKVPWNLKEKEVSIQLTKHSNILSLNHDSGKSSGIHHSICTPQTLL